MAVAFTGGDRRFLAGSLDEVRISSGARSADWVWAEWMNMASNAVFNAYGRVERGGCRDAVFVIR